MVREELLAAIGARVQRIIDTRDLAPARDPQAHTEAVRLAELLQASSGNADDLRAWYGLGWLQFYRFLAKADADNEATFTVAIEAFAHCFLAGVVEGLPETALPMIAEAAAPHATAMSHRTNTSTDPALLSAAVDVWERIVGAVPAEHPNRPAYLGNLSLALLRRGGRTGSRADLDEAVARSRQALRAVPDDHSDRRQHLANLGVMLRARFPHTGERADLEEAIGLFRVLASTGPDRPEYLGSLGLTLWMRGKLTADLADLADLDEAVEHLRVAVDATPADSPDRPELLASLGTALRTRGERTGSRADLESAAAHLRAAVDARTAPPARYSHNLGLALWARFRRGGECADLDEAVEHLRVAVDATPADSPDRPAALADLGTALWTRSARTGDRADLDESIVRLRTAVETTPADDPGRATSLNGLGIALHARYERTGNRADLDEAISTAREALSALPADAAARTRHLANLAAALRARFLRTGSRADLDEAITIGREASESVSPDDPGHSDVLANLGATLRTRYEHAGGQADLDEAVGRLRAAVEATPADHPHRASHRSVLANALMARFEHTGSEADLDTAITFHREALAAVPTDDAERPMLSANLGGALWRRFQRAGGMADLEEAVVHLRTAVNATPADHPGQADRLSDLGTVLFTRFQRTGSTVDLEEAVVHLRTAVNATPADHPAQARYLLNLGAALRLRYSHAGHRADLDDAITTWRMALTLSMDIRDRSRCLLNLGIALRVRFKRTGNGADLEEAVTSCRSALTTLSAEDSERARGLYELGVALEARHRHTGEKRDLDEAVSAYTGAWEPATGAPSDRIDAARAAAALAAGVDVGKAADAAEAAVRLLPEVASRQIGREDQQYALGRFAGLAGEAATLALADPRTHSQERAARALRLLEAGRAVLYSQALDTRSDLTELHQRHPHLAARFVQLRDQLDQPHNLSLLVPPGGEDSDAAGMREESSGRDRHRLARDFAQTLTEIRALDGFTSFALPPTTEELLAEAAHGPVVVFTIGRDRGDALLLTHEGITHLGLPELTAKTLVERVNAFRRALNTATAGEHREQRQQAQNVLTGTLQWLWDAVTEPVLDALGYRQQPTEGADWPRVWWAPGGLLGLMPLHAAGYHTDPADDPNRRTVMDRVVSSYTPTVRALRHARQYLRRQTHDPDVPPQGLIVAMPTTPGLPGHGRLRHVDTEAELVQRHLRRTVLLREPDAASSPGLPENAPTKTAVLDLLPDCTIAHFACHGASHPVDPSRSRLLLHDHEIDPLTVASLAPVRLDRTQLAYLSACRTASIDTAGLIDEAIHLTSAFQLAGFPHVVGTLWEIDDRTAVTVADAFYTHLRTPTGTIDTSRAAWSLHQAVRALRDGHDLPAQLDRNRIPSLWAAYLHVGA
ncbi:CHAT domain-containing protein [Streptomyces albogriseolus]|uniref:CHAT domain-containing protein n=1 Tax=Streptomyces albogriseolus TaxID=1887 RepID=UPI0036CA7EC4